MGRALRYLEWARPVSITERAETALVREAAGEAGESFAACMEEFLGGPYAGQYEAVDDPSFRWAHARLTNGAMSGLRVPDDQSVNAQAHSVHYASDFGSSPIADAASETRITALLDGVTDDDRDSVAQCLLALHGLGRALPAARLTVLTAWYDQPWGDWPEEYHPRCVAAVLFALRGD